MNKKAIISSIIISLLISLIIGGLLIGAGVLVIIFPTIFNFVINCALMLIGVSMIITTIPNLVVGIVNCKRKKALFDLIFSILTMVVGLILGAFGLFSLIQDIATPDVIQIGMSILHYVLCILMAIYMIILPVVRIFTAESKWNQFKLELVKIIFGVLLLVLILCGLLVSVLNNLIGLLLIVAGALTVLLAIINFIVGLIGIKKADKNPAVAVAVDVDGDGKADAVGIDVDGDGKIDVVGVDVDGDGKVDAVVTNESI
jgi:hypothetical protein